jgi:energy-coupling factor transport system ATP-binding protein
MIASVRGVTYRYPGAPAPALRGVDLDIAGGDLVLVAGPSAGGKSSLLRLFNGLIPQFHGGSISGRVLVAGLDAARTPTRRLATVAGMVFQEPEAQSVADTVEEDIVFGMEQQGVAPHEMRRRLDGLLELLGIEALRGRRLTTLSGGERQRVAIAAAMALEPRLLLLDEPSSQLDGAGADAVFAAMETLRERAGATVLVAEHRLDRLLPRAASVVEVADGTVTALPPREAAAALRAVPAVCELGRRLGLDPLPLTVEDARAALACRGLRARPVGEAASPGGTLLSVEGLTVAFDGTEALRDVSVALREGEVIALLGANGSGKTTLFRAIAGLLRPRAGSVRFRGRPAPAAVAERSLEAGFVPQDPVMALYRDSVRDEVLEGLRFRGLADGVARALEDWDVHELADRNPRDLSVGQQQRVAIAAMLAHGPRAWLMDEPTRGADGPTKAWLAARLRAHAAAGGAAIVATHDLESAATFATRVVALDRGEVVVDLPARRAFSAEGPFPTQVARLVPGAITADEVVS